ncbi:MAG: hypothetical protein UU47_C0008G0004 [candidate division TM6 bacterium GW2011_GWE2_41_16]|nr:MAG: hypothetical protein UU47_C0008G0004 [candidate division TM6 bacterium GW2011_GWE2_41_16]
MLTPAQETWLAYLNDTDSIEIHPADPHAAEKFEKIKNRIQTTLGEQTVVEHCGSTNMGISGQGELDVYIPVRPEQFDQIVDKVAQIFEKPGSRYPLERARFVTHVDGTKVEVFVINQQSQGWIDCCRFESYLKTHHETLEAYRMLKEAGRGLSTQKYYRKKTAFINEILDRESAIEKE